MNPRQNVSSGAQWEAKVGYSRLVKTGNHIFVAGTTGKGKGIEAQTRSAFEIIEKSLAQVGASMKDVTRTRMFLKDIKRDNEVVGRIHEEYFRSVRPAATMVGVSSLIDDDLLVEIEVDAVMDVSVETMKGGKQGGVTVSGL